MSWLVREPVSCVRSRDGVVAGRAWRATGVDRRCCDPESGDKLAWPPARELDRAKRPGPICPQAGSRRGSRACGAEFDR